MKNTKQFISAILIMFIGAYSLNAAEPIKGESHTEFGKYRIVPSENPLLLEDEELTTYDLIYDNLKSSIRIGVKEKRRCKDFIVKGPNFEVKYVCSKDGFGVRRVDERNASVHPSTVTHIMDDVQFNYQEVIVNQSKPTDELLHLIACFFPHLIKKDIRESLN